MKLSELLADVPQEWHRSFVQFVETGEAEQPFLEYLDSDPRGQRAVEEAFTAQAGALEELGRHVRSARSRPVPEVAAAPKLAAAQAVSAAFEKVLALPDKERSPSLVDAVEAMARARGGGLRRELQTAADEFRQAVEKMVP